MALAKNYNNLNAIYCWFHSQQMTTGNIFLFAGWQLLVPKQTKKKALLIKSHEIHTGSNVIMA